MACPHSFYSSPSSCSQCLGATPRKVAVVDGVIQIDGKPFGVEADINRAKFREETENGLPTKRRSCGNCRKPGHRIETCPDRKAQADDLSAN